MACTPCRNLGYTGSRSCSTCSGTGDTAKVGEVSKTCTKCAGSGRLCSTCGKADV